MNVSKKMLSKIISNHIEDIPEYKILTILDVTFNEIINELCKGNNIIISNFGVFKVTKLNTKTIQHPVTKEMIVMPEHYTVRFIKSKRLKKLI